MHSNQSHALELEQGPLGINALGSPRTVIVDDGPNVVAVATNDSQILPSHLKCGMWASLALATVFLAGKNPLAEYTHGQYAACD